ncbi:MAG TPA: class I fructose-bisphosphate aldolase [Candidatus Paceibacterota bacterium]|nr:class I fructose-bisphosphate aldolase [Candidatus Paceibacterota bacterium]
MSDLSATLRSLMAPGKGILAADESNDSADEKRLKAYGIKTGPEMRRKFRDLFLSAPGIEEYLSGVILYKETLDQKGEEGTSFPQILRNKGIVPGIKVDEGLDPLTDGSEETITKGLIGLPERLSEYREKHGTGFTKWRAAIRIDGDRLPTSRALVENAKRLAAYACEAQKAGMVPMVEPEVLLEGKHSRVRARKVIEETLSTLFTTLNEQCADLSCLILKTSVALSGSGSGRTDSPEEVAVDTLDALMATVPADVGGIVFLSGGQTPDQATENLRAIVALARERGAPWPITYSYARAFQEEALALWKGEEENVEIARTAFLARLKKAKEAIS